MSGKANAVKDIIKDGKVIDDDVTEKGRKTPDYWEDKIVVEDDMRASRNTDSPQIEDVSSGLFSFQPARTKVRRPPKITRWLGIESNTDDSEEENNTEWNIVDQRKANEEKRKRAKSKKDDLQKECAQRAANMASIGPISSRSVNYFRKDGVEYEAAKIMAVKEFLAYNLGYEEEELRNLQIMETRMSQKGDIINVAMAKEEDIREFYIRKAELKKEDIIVRNYVLPNFHQRYLNSICTERRKKYLSLKTQLRFGHRDMEVYTKYKGEEGGLRKVDLEDFCDKKMIPPFDMKIVWKQYEDKPPRRKAT